MKLQEVCEVYSGYALKEFHDSDEGYPVIKIGNICSDGTLDLVKCQFTHDCVNEKYYSKKGDIYIALSGATTGKIGINNVDDKYIINQRVGIVRKINNHIPEQFIKYFLMNKTEKILEDASGCAQPNISPKQIGLYEFPKMDSLDMINIAKILDCVSKIIEQRKLELQKMDELIKARFVELFGDPVNNSKGLPELTLPELGEFGRGVSKHRPRNNIFIHYWFLFFQAILEAQAPESAQKNINLKILSELKIIVPPIEQQNEFATFVEQTDKSKIAVQKALDEAQLLFDSLMQKYFG